MGSQPTKQHGVCVSEQQCCSDGSVAHTEHIQASGLQEKGEDIARDIVRTQPIFTREAEESMHASTPKLQDQGTRLENGKETLKTSLEDVTIEVSTMEEEELQQTADYVQHGAHEVMPKLDSTNEPEMVLKGDEALGKSEVPRRSAHPLIKSLFSPTGGNEVGDGFWKISLHKTLFAFPIGLAFGMIRFLPNAIFWEDRFANALASALMLFLPLSMMAVGFFGVWFDQALPAWHLFVLAPMPAIPALLLINLTELNGVAVCPAVFTMLMMGAMGSVLIDARRHTSWPLKPLVVGMAASLHCMFAGIMGGWLVMWSYTKILTEVSPAVATLCFNPMFFVLKNMQMLLSSKGHDFLKRYEIKGLARDLKGRVKTMDNFMIHASIETAKINTLLASIVLAPNLAWVPTALISVLVKVLARTQWFEALLYMVFKRCDTKKQRLLHFCKPSVKRDAFLNAMMPASWCSLTGAWALVILRLVMGYENPFFNNDFPVVLCILMGIGLVEDILVYLLDKTHWTGVLMYWASSKELEQLCMSEGYDGEKYFAYSGRKSSLSKESERPFVPMIYCLTQFAIQAFTSVEALAMWLSLHFLLNRCSEAVSVSTAIDNGFFYFENAALCPHTS